MAKAKKKKGDRVLFEERVVCPYCSKEMNIKVTEKILTPSTPAEKEKETSIEKVS
jgi:hypothetical protein